MDEWHKTGIVCAVLVAAGWVCLKAIEVDGEAGRLDQPRAFLATAAPLVPCAQAALMFHDVRWAASCMAQAEQDAAQLAACLQDPQVMADPARGRAHCERSFGASDGSADCTLPEGPAGRLNALLGEAERRCTAEAVAAR